MSKDSPKLYDLKENYELENSENYYTQSLFYELTGKRPSNIVFQWINKFLKGNCKIVELGLNPGTITIDLARMGVNVIGVDPSPKKIVFAQHINHIELERYQIFKNHINFVFPFEDFITTKFKIMNLNNLDITEESIDIVFSDSGLLSLDLMEALSECKRIVNNKGVIIFNINTNNNLSWGSKDPTREKTFNKITPKQLKCWALANNFKILYLNYIKKSNPKNLKSLITNFWNKQNILFVAEKQS